MNNMNVNNMSYRELRDFVKNNGGASRFGNYTHFTTEELRQAAKQVVGTKKLINTIAVNNVEVSSAEEALNTIIKIAQKALTSKTDKENEDLHAKLMNIEFELNH